MVKYGRNERRKLRKGEEGNELGMVRSDITWDGSMLKLYVYQ